MRRMFRAYPARPCGNGSPGGDGAAPRAAKRSAREWLAPEDTLAKHDPLETYVRKRNFSDTPEPKGAPRKSSRRLRFVIQKHRATRLHYDFRLEAGGVLASWAVPKGPSRDTHERRLAMHVEDHPFAYRTFEGVIPDGNYGAGEVIVWDEGTYRLAEGTDPVAEIAAGKIKFVLAGTKLHGMYSLVKIKNRGGESGEPWLLIKDHDEFVDPAWTPDDQPQSAKTGKTLADIAAGRATAKTWRSDRAAAPAASEKTKRATRRAKLEPVPTDAAPMLATLVGAPFDDSGWLFEFKWDGYRAIAAIDEHGGVTLTSRAGNDLLGQFPELAGLGSAFASLPIVVDGEICILDERGRSSFQALQSRDKRFATGKPSKTPVTFIVFDCLYADGRDLRGEPLEARKARLESLIVPDRGVMFSKHILGAGKQLYAFALREALEGIVGKERNSPYRGARSREWVKIKAKHRQEFVIGGWTEPRGSRKGFGALLLGVYEADQLHYVGHVGTGFDEAQLRALGKALAAIEVPAPPFATRPKTNTKAHWVQPQLVAEIEFAEWTRDGILRQPVFVGLRADKQARDVARERELPASEHA
jgi:bifunctional non-homologous end joining protein LigD